MPSSGGIGPVNLFPCRYLNREKWTVRHVTTYKNLEFAFFPFATFRKKNSQFSCVGQVAKYWWYWTVKLILTQIPDPWNKIKMNWSNIPIISYVYQQNHETRKCIWNFTYRTARACINPMTSGILPVNLFPCNDLTRRIYNWSKL